MSSWSPYQRISGVKAVSFEEYCLKESFGDEPRLPETLLLESFLQLGNWLILLSSDFKQMGMVVRISEVRFQGFLLPGRQLRMEVTLARRREDGFELSGEGRVEWPDNHQRFGLPGRARACRGTGGPGRPARAVLGDLRAGGAWYRMRPTRPYTYLGTVHGMCRECRALVPARVLEEGGAVYQERLCPKCGPSRARIADGVEWYLDRTATTVRCKPARLPGREVRDGCPHDCGPCAFHANACHLPVFSVTNACNMDCPICFTYNRPDRKYFMSREELRSLLDKLIARAGPFDLINITGGEPTLHPQILELLEECRRPEIGRVTMNSNGLRLATDEDFCRALADLGVYVILSFDTFQTDRALKIHGRDVLSLKRRALENLQRFGIGTTLLNVMIRGVNEDEIGRIIELARAHSGGAQRDRPDDDVHRQGREKFQAARDHAAGRRGEGD